jgi:MarR family transcriptional regulator, organic hydroperoxide resistance regulator
MTSRPGASFVDVSRAGEGNGGFPDNANGNGEVPIEDYLCLALYTASRAVTGFYRDLLAELELTYPQYLVMRLLWQRGSTPVKDIGSTLALDYGTLSPLLKRLEARGLIRRERRSDDERSVQISLTDQGEAMAPKADRVPTELTCAVGLDEHATDQLLSTLRLITEAVSSGAPAEK